MHLKLRLALVLTACIPFAHAQTPAALAADAKGAWTAISTNLVKSAEKMPEELYSYRPTEKVRSFAQVIGHLVDANYLFCSAINPDKKTGIDAENKLTAKADLVAALHASVAYCDAAVEKVAQGQAVQVKLFGRERAGLSVLNMNIAHSNEHYGNIVTYLRLKDIVPPSSEPRGTASR